MIKKVLFIDDKKVEFELLEKLFSDSKFFELVNKEPMFDESSRDVLTREEQKRKIISLIENEDYDIVLFDLSLRSDLEENYRSGEAKNLLSIEIYNEMRNWLSERERKFIFITSHERWKKEESFRKIGDAVTGALFMRKPADVEEGRSSCAGYDENGETKCGEKFSFCKKGECFIKILRRKASDG